MTKMGLAESALSLRAHHSEGNIFMFAHILFGDRLKKTGPAGARIKLGARIKQCVVAIDTTIQACAVFVVQRTSERPFRGGAAGDVKLQSSKLRLPLWG